MPELPEVEVIRRGLNAVLPGKAITGIEVLEQRSFPTFDLETEKRIIGSVFQEVRRRGKLLIIVLKSSAREEALLVHLRMTGQLVYRGPSTGQGGFAGGYPSQSLVSGLPDKHTHVVFSLDDGSRLYFNDQRKFGYLKLIALSDIDQDDFLHHLGIEPLDGSFTWQALRAALQGKAKNPAQAKASPMSVKAALLDQKRIAGIGNIYADESLFRAGIDPRRSLASLKVGDYRRLQAAIRECLNQSIIDGGSTSRNYVDSFGLRGEYLDLHAAVYGRSGQACPRCGKPITKIRLAGRGTHLCEHCQR
ncbi:MAG: bifunctional DNA-formamidopyrimidine glycosylase/DNA-(apurinic or apyrimidinic site) lyase [Coriobacteriia bacterium]|nr:bifunctional DNA-formamidopyrimidine glycosylase/DNA-(apurinic or apyrimidinic site) lyase [Coriobacteriia bacterium]